MTIKILGPFRFQSTLPLRGATVCLCKACGHHWISIHAPLTGSDAPPLRVSDFECHFNPRSPYGERLGLRRRHPTASDFNPRSPYGERLEQLNAVFRDNLFQSTLPLRGATDMIPSFAQKVNISIHAPLTGSDPRGLSGLNRYFRFQSTLPLRGATYG